MALMYLLTEENMYSLAMDLALPGRMAVHGPGSWRAAEVAFYLILAPCRPFSQGMAILINPARLQ